MQGQLVESPAGVVLVCEDGWVKLSAKADYAVRAVLVLAAHDGDTLMKGEAIARAQDLPPKFVEGILSQLKNAGIVASQRGPDGGYRLARPASEVTLAEVMRIVDGPIAAVAGVRPEDVSYPPGAEALPAIWLKAREALRSVLDETTFQDIVERSETLHHEPPAPR